MKKRSVLLAAVAMMGLTAATMAQVPDYVPTQGLVGWWPFNGNANDESGNGNDGMVNGATLVEDRFGQADKAYAFDGQGNYIQVANSNSLNFTTGTVNVWVNTPEKKLVTLLCKNQYLTSFAEAWNLQLDGNTGSITLYTKHGSSCTPGLGWKGFTATTGLNFSTWKMITAVIASDSTHIYLNGERIQSLKTPGQMDNCPGDVQIGRFWRNDTKYYSGALDDIGIWNRVLTQKEIINLYSAQSSCQLISTATFTVPEKREIVLQGQVLRMNQSSFNQVDLNKWNYIAWVKTSDNGGKIYKNGKLVFSGNFQNVSYGYYRLDLGAEYYFGWGNFYKGLIDEVRISNVERSQSEIIDHYSANKPFVQDTNTVGLWHFDENAGLVTNGVVGPPGTISNGTWVDGRFGSCVDYNGTSTTASMDLTIPTSNMTIEFWLKPNGYPKAPSDFRPVSLNGFNTTTFIISKDTIQTQYTWSTGATTNSVTVDPSTMPYIWVTDGNCTDTIWFQQQSATVYDTTFITVTDTLLINTTISGVGQPDRVNTIKIFPNPASTHITIDYGDIAILNGYRLRITNSLGQEVFQTAITQPSEYLDLSGWGGNGLYFVHLIDPQGNILDIRKIVLR